MTADAPDAQNADIPPPHSRPFATLRTIFALMVREMATAYGRSPGGYAWAVLEPVGAIAILSFAFSMAFRAPLLGTNFPYFYASGYLIFMVYQDIANKTMGSLKFSRSLLAYPAVTHVDAIIARFLLAALTHATVIVIVLTGIIFVFDVPVILRPTWMATAFVMAATLGIGIGTLNCVIIGLFPVWERIWSVLNRPAFLISGILFTYESLGSEIQAWFWFNPLIHIIGAMRAGMFITYDPHYISFTYVFGIALTTLALGLVLLKRYHLDIINGR